MKSLSLQKTVQFAVVILQYMPFHNEFKPRM